MVDKGVAMSILVLMGSWQAPSELFIVRQLHMLKDLGLLNCIVAARLHGNTEWHGYKVFGLSDKNYELLGNEHPNLELQMAKLSQIIKDTDVDAIICHFGTVASLFFDLLQSTRKSLFIQMHGKDSHIHMHNPNYVQKIRLLSKKSFLICNPVTYRLLSDKEWGISRERLKLKTVYGVEVPDKPPKRPDRRPITILHLGRLVDFKGPDKTIQAFEIACNYGLVGKLLIAGDGPLRQLCEQLINSSAWKEKIHLLGFVTPAEAKNLYMSADIFTQHSLVGANTGQIEAFGVSIIEAMATALPVITCAIGGPGMNVDHEETGILVEPGDITAQANAFLQLADDFNRRVILGTNAWRKVKHNFSYEHELSELKRILINEMRP